MAKCYFFLVLQAGLQFFSCSSSNSSFLVLIFACTHLFHISTGLIIILFCKFFIQIYCNDIVAIYDNSCNHQTLVRLDQIQAISTQYEDFDKHIIWEKPKELLNEQEKEIIKHLLATNVEGKKIMGISFDKFCDEPNIFVEIETEKGDSLISLCYVNLFKNVEIDKKYINIINYKKFTLIIKKFTLIYKNVYFILTFHIS